MHFEPADFLSFTITILKNGLMSVSFSIILCPFSNSPKTSSLECFGNVPCLDLSIQGMYQGILVLKDGLGK
jgi:hypothetical protein